MEYFSASALRICSIPIFPRSFDPGTLISFDDVLNAVYGETRSAISTQGYMQVAEHIKPNVSTGLAEKLLALGGLGIAGGLSYMAWRKYGKSLAQSLIIEKNDEEYDIGYHLNEEENVRHEHDTSDDENDDDNGDDNDNNSDGDDTDDSDGSDDDDVSDDDGDDDTGMGACGDYGYESGDSDDYVYSIVTPLGGKGDADELFH